MNPLGRSTAASRGLFSAFHAGTAPSSQAKFPSPRPEKPAPLPAVIDPWGPLLQPRAPLPTTPERDLSAIVDPWGQGAAKHGVGAASLDGALHGTSGELPRELTVAQLRAVMPRLSFEQATQYQPALQQTMVEFGITTPQRKAAFLAQIAYESGELRVMEERASGAAYEGRKDLGNVRPGDGVRFKGRGPIQLTGRHNYREAGRALGLDLEKSPELVARDPVVAFRVAGWYWKSRRLNEVADRGDLATITKRIQGTATDGAAQRSAYYRGAQRALRT